MSVKSSIRAMTIAFAALAGTAMVASANDRVIVEFPFNVTVGNKVLEPGKYTIARLPNSTSRVLLIHNDEGKFQAMMMPIPTYSLKTPEETKVVLHKVGDHEYHFDKIWVQGKSYGYEMPLPASVKSRQAEWLLAKSATPPAVFDGAALSEAGDTEVAEVAAEAAEEAPWSDRTTAVETVAADEPKSEPDLLAYAAPHADVGGSGSAGADALEMPETAANWLPMVLLGGAIPTVGLWACRRR